MFSSKKTQFITYFFHTEHQRHWQPRLVSYLDGLTSGFVIWTFSM